MNVSDASRSRLPPYSEESERGLLGSLLIEADRVYALCVNKNITSDVFYVPAHKILYEAITGMRQRNQPIDLLTVGEALKKLGRLEQAGGYIFLEGLIDSTPTSAHAEYYIELILVEFAKRQWITLFAQGMDAVYDGGIDELSAMVDEQSSKISKLLNADQLQTDHISVSGNILQENIRLKVPVLVKIKSGINTVSNRILGYAKGKVTVIAARPGKGKTSWAASEALYVAQRGVRVSILSLEMEAKEYMARLACIHGQIPIEDYIDGKLDETQRDILSLAIEQVGKLPIRINDHNMNFKQVREWMKNESKKADVLILDLFTKIRRAGGKRFSNDQSEWSYMARIISDDIKTLGPAMLLLHQIHRISNWGKSEKNPPPKLDDLKDTGALEEEAYMVMLLHDAPVDKDNPAAGNYTCIVAKHRNGWSGKIPVTFISEHTQFKGAGQ